MTGVDMKRILDDVVVYIIVGGLSAAIALLLRLVGLNAQDSLVVALALAVVTIFILLVTRLYGALIRLLTEALLMSTLASPRGRERIEKIVSNLMGNRFSFSVTEYPSQDVCMPQIVDAYRRARMAKILTIRGERLFGGKESFLFKLVEKRSGDHSTKLLVLNPAADQIVRGRASQLGQRRPDDVLEKMVADYQQLAYLAKHNQNFEVKCYFEVPNFKILMFDDVMFFSCYVSAKNDSQTPMLRIVGKDTFLYKGLDGYFDALWQRAMFMEERNVAERS